MFCQTSKGKQVIDYHRKFYKNIRDDSEDESVGLDYLISFGLATLKEE